MINKTKPYILYSIDNVSELEKIQIYLFSKGYKWLDGPNVDITFVNMYSPPKFPIYISNLPNNLIGDIQSDLDKRKNFNEYNNNILFFSVIKEDFDLNLLRKYKLLKIKSYD